MEYKPIECKEHGGTFMVEKKRGRPPTKCSPDNVCNMARRSKSAKAVAQRTAETLKGKLPTSGDRNIAKIAAIAKLAATASKQREEVREIQPLPATKSRPRASSAIVHVNPSIPVARELREDLEPLGWTAHASTDGRNAVNFTATRDSETITIRIENGKILTQNYTVWDADRPSSNGMPRVKLPFDPDELSDVDLLRELAGQKVTWWNRIGKSKESAVLPHTDGKKITVQHVVTVTDGEPDELPGSRIVTFVDAMGNTGFRSFAIGSLMKIG